jgi:Ca2+-binding RTX toxin-like protein
MSTIYGTTGDEQLIGTADDDVLDGGAGNDVLVGDLGADTYLFGQGYGNDQIHNYEPEGAQSLDRILLKPEVTAADVELKLVTVDANGWSIPPSLQLRLKSTGETLTVYGHFDTNAVGANPAIDSIEFADGTVWDLAEIERRAHLIEGTVGDDWLMGTTGNDVLDGGAGNDHLAGDLGADTYVFGMGSGNDVIHNFEPDGQTAADRILLKPEVSAADVQLKVVTMDANGWSIPPSLQLMLRSTGETLTVLGQFDTQAIGMNPAIDSIEFADGTVWNLAEIERRAHLIEGTVGDDWLMGTTGNDVLDGGAGNDHLAGDLGADTYVFGMGSGNDVIHNFEPDGQTAADRILLKPEVSAADVQLKVVTMDANGWSIPPSLQLMLRSTGETLTVLGQFDTQAIGMNPAIDSIEFADGTVWNLAEIERRAHLIEGTVGDDWLMGTTGNDVLDGGAGNDQLAGLEGNDTYVFGQGYGNDVIYDYDSTTGNTDAVQFLSGVATDQLWFRQVNSDLEVSVIGSNDKVTLAAWYQGSQSHVEQFKTADGHILLDSSVENLVQAMAAFAPPPAGQTTLPQDYAATLNPVIAANWQ